MQKRETDPIAQVISLDAARERRQYIALAHANAVWQQVKASFALSGIELDDKDAEMAGRVLAGAITEEQGREKIVCSLGIPQKT